MQSNKHKDRFEIAQGSIAIHNDTNAHFHTCASTNTASNVNSNNNDDRCDRQHHFRRGISRLLERSTIHGLPHISTSSNNFIRLIWLTVWLTSVVGFSTNLKNILLRYLSQPVLTSYYEDSEEFQWPDIIFCDAVAPYNLTTFERRKLWNHYVTWARNLTTMNHISIDFLADNNRNHDEEFVIQSLVHSSIPYWRFNVGSVDDMFYFIYREDEQQGIRKTVEVDFKLSYLPKPWKNYFYIQILEKRFNIPCLNFQLRRYLNKSELDRIKEVQFGIKPNYQSYLIVNSSYYPHLIDVYITSPDHFPSKTFIKLTPGYMYHVKLEMVQHKQVHENRICHNENYSAILYDGDLMMKRSVHANGGDLCHRLLSQYLYLQECHCYSPFLPYGYFPDLLNSSHHKINTNTKGPISQPVLCLNMSVFNQYELTENLNCMHRVFTKYSNVSLYMSLEEAKRCEYYSHSRYCDEMKYNHNSVLSRPLAELWGNTYNEARAKSLFSFFRHTLLDEGSSNDNDDKRNSTEYDKHISENESTHQDTLFKFRNQYTILMVKRVSPHRRLILIENKYPLSRLLADIGGNLGLWIGISVFGLFEFFQLFGFIIYASVNWIKRFIIKLFKP